MTKEPSLQHDDDGSNNSESDIVVDRALQPFAGLNIHEDEEDGVASIRTASGTTSPFACINILGLGEDVFQHIVAYLDPYDLSMLDSSCSTTRRLCQRVWRHLKSNIVATPYAWADFQTDFPNSSSSSSSNPKGLAILEYRAQAFAARAEINRGHNVMKDDNDRDDVGDTTLIRCPECGLLPLIEVQTFREPEAFYFFLRLSAIASAPTPTCASSNEREGKEKSSSNNSAKKHSMVLWEGFSSPMEQGAWGESTILFFHLKEINNKIEWTKSMKDAFNFGMKNSDSIDTSQYQNRLKQGLDNLSLTIVAFRKSEECCFSTPELVVFSTGINSVSRDNRMYYRIRSQHCRRKPSKDGRKESWVYPTLVTNKVDATHSSTELLGMRVVCKGIA